MSDMLLALVALEVDMNHHLAVVYEQNVSQATTLFQLDREAKDLRLSVLHAQEVEAKTPQYLRELESRVRREESDREVAEALQRQMDAERQAAEVRERERRARAEQQRDEAFRRVQRQLEDEAQAEAARLRASRAPQPSPAHLHAPAPRSPQPSLSTSLLALQLGVLGPLPSHAHAPAPRPPQPRLSASLLPLQSGLFVGQPLPSSELDDPFIRSVQQTFGDNPFFSRENMERRNREAQDFFQHGFRRPH